MRTCNVAAEKTRLNKASMQQGELQAARVCRARGAAQPDVESRRRFVSYIFGICSKFRYVE